MGNVWRGHRQQRHVFGHYWRVFNLTVAGQSTNSHMIML
ncbi:hypothetical protein LMG23994_07065 [Cupriavidus pinatubonensis]|uniref:Uncharacterized protein n=1 Tax=Cupriavidus pinatubonensis TaxID=248026 RepID=A0ABN7ZRM3_9BURK|nr:hypothetical protein LMG23994_07065 [Cupriavidus pinatubonensis]